MKQKSSIIYRPGTKSELVEPKNGKFFKLKELQSIVGGYIECLYLKDDMTMVVNEEGKLDGLPFNDMATAIAYNSSYADSIVGSVLVCPSKLIQ